MSEEGHRRFETTPPSMLPPRTVADLVRRRVHTGNAQADAGGLREAGPHLADGARAPRRRHPSLLAKVPVFVSVWAVAAVRARAMVRRGDFTTWLRESCRA